jgi:PAS domain-containing protein
MTRTNFAVERLLATALEAVERGGVDLISALEALDAPIYLTDTNGVVTYFNKDCVGFAGRVPLVGKDRWCVTWRLYTDDGAFLPHDQCPLAVAIRTRKPIRGVTAFAERPDGTRVQFMPYPTPIIGDHGEMLGAINLLIDVTDERQIEDFRRQAERCRRLAAAVDDRRAATALRRMAAEYDDKAAALNLSQDATTGEDRT